MKWSQFWIWIFLDRGHSDKYREKKEAIDYRQEKNKQFWSEPNGLAPPLGNIMNPIDKPSIRPGENIPEDMIVEIEDAGLYLGLERKYGKGYYVGKRAEDDGNVLAVGINGSGKSHILAKSMIETWQKPFVALDFKGELSHHYRRLLREGRVKRKYIVFDPFDSNIPYDPFALIRRDEVHLTQNANEIVNAIIPKPLNDPNSYWLDLARNLLSDVIVHCYSIGLDFIETMIVAVDISVSGLCRMIIGANSSRVKKSVKDIAEMKSEHQAIIATEMKRHLMNFATDQDIQDALSNDKGKKSFSWEDIVTADDAPNVFLRLSQDRMEQWDGMIRLMLTRLIRTLERRPDKQSPQGRKINPILLLLDEFPLLGKMDAITNALTTLRSKKVTFCLMLQSIAQLDAVYGRDIRKIIVDNCQYKALLNITEPDSQEYFSKLIGTVPIGRRSFSQSYNPTTDYSTYGRQIQEFREPLILPHEFATNKDILLHTPYGLLSTIKLPVSETHLHVNDHKKIIQKYMEERR